MAPTSRSFSRRSWASISRVSWRPSKVRSRRAGFSRSATSAGRNRALAVILGSVGSLCAGLFLVRPVAALFHLPTLDAPTLGAAALTAGALYLMLRLAKPRFSAAFTR